MQRFGCRALCALATAHLENQDAVAEAGGIEAVVAAIAWHAGVEDVQEYGCIALGALASDNPSNQTGIAAARGIECLITAMRTHVDADGVQMWGCASLRALAKLHPANQVSAPCTDAGLTFVGGVHYLNTRVLTDDAAALSPVGLCVFGGASFAAIMSDYVKFISLDANSMALAVLLIVVQRAIFRTPIPTVS